jgi:hypothetical protein
MKLYRKLIVAFFLIGIVGWHVFAVSAQQDHWPFSNYPMYAKLQAEREFSNVRIVAFTDETPPRRIVERSTHLRTLMARLARREIPDPARIERTIRDHFGRYGQRDDKDLGGARIAEVRIYKQTWVLRPDAGNRDQPDRNELIARVKVDPPATTPTTEPSTRPVSKKRKKADA